MLVHWSRNCLATSWENNNNDGDDGDDDDDDDSGDGTLGDWPDTSIHVLEKTAQDIRIKAK